MVRIYLQFGGVTVENRVETRYDQRDQEILRLKERTENEDVKKQQSKCLHFEIQQLVNNRSQEGPIKREDCNR